MVAAAAHAKRRVVPPGPPSVKHHRGPTFNKAQWRLAGGSVATVTATPSAGVLGRVSAPFEPLRRDGIALHRSRRAKSVSCVDRERAAGQVDKEDVYRTAALRTSTSTESGTAEDGTHPRWDPFYYYSR